MPAPFLIAYTEPVDPSAVVLLKTFTDPSFSARFATKASRPSLRRLPPAWDRRAGPHRSAFLDWLAGANDRARGALADAGRLTPSVAHDLQCPACYGSATLAGEVRTGA